MKNIKLLNFLSSILGNYKEFSNGEYYFKCPFSICSSSHKKKLAINLESTDDSHFMHWHCWVCNTSGNNLYTLLKRVNTSPNKLQELKDTLRGTIQSNINAIQFNSNGFDKKLSYISLPKEFKSFKDISAHPECINALHYLRGRGISFMDIVKYKMGYCDSGDYHGYIVIPSYDISLNINYFVARDYYGRSYRYKNPTASKNIIFNEVHINWNEKVILCEGVFDAIAIKRNAIPLLGKSINSALRLKLLQEKVKDVYLCLDNDAIYNSIQYIEEFLKNDINVYYVKLPAKDPSELGFMAVNELIKNAKKMDFLKLIELKINMKGLQ